MSEDEQQVNTAPKVSMKKNKTKGGLTAKAKSELTRAVHMEETAVMNPVEYQQMKRIAEDIVSSGAVPDVWKNASQALVGISAGRELGMMPVESLNSLYIVNGAVRVWGRGVPRLVRRHGWRIGYTDEDGVSTCTVTLTNTETKEEIVETYNFDEAQKSGYTTDRQGRLKFGWKEGINRRKKLRYGALGLAVDTHIPEVLGSVQGIVEVEKDYTPELETRHVENQTNNVQSRIESAIEENKDSILDMSEAPKPIKE